MEEFAKQLGIKHPGELVNDKFIIPLMNSDEYSQVYTLLDKSDLVDLDPYSTLVTEKVSELTYIGDDYSVKLDANFMDDFYRVVIFKNEE